ncbi:MAG: hypothetical protein IJC39_01205, partial [Firmicutes bacterium]|nr:hypothetical protein [Bacillota bacterium]
EASAVYNAAESDELEKELADILSFVKGAGEVRVMITYRSHGGIDIAEEVVVSESINAEGETTREEERKAVLLENQDGSTAPLVLNNIASEVVGVVIVAKGGDDILVSESLFRAAQALLDLPVNKIEVLKME